MQKFPYQRIMIIGCSGSGKSTLARKLARHTGLPIIHLDQEFWHADWVQTERMEWVERVWDLTEEEAWIMDGNYAGTMRIRLTRADLVIWLDFPTWLCLLRAVLRILWNYGHTRSDMAEGCPEWLDWKFLKYIWNFRKKHRPRILQILQRRSDYTELLVFKSDYSLRRWLRTTFS